MTIELVIAALICIVLGVLHAMVGVTGVLPSVTKERLSATRFGPPALTAGMVRFTWHMTTVILLGFGGLFAALAASERPPTVVLRWAGLLFTIATLVAFYIARWRLRAVLRFPVAIATAVIAGLCWVASA